MATRRKAILRRQPNGQPHREREFPPVQVRRLRDAALSGLRDPEWGTELGRLYLARRISEAQYAAGKWWVETAAWYHQALGVQPLRSASVELGRGGSSPDPDSMRGKELAVREAERAERYFEAHSVLMNAGQGAERAVRDVCESGLACVSSADLMALRVGLLALAVHRGLTDRNKASMQNAI
jgi:hypothetical protein